MQPAEVSPGSDDQVEPPASTAWQELFTRERARGFPGVAGSRAHAALPITQALLDEAFGPGPFILGGWSFAVRLLEGPRIGLEVRRSVLGLPVGARTTLAIDREATGGGVLVLRYPDSMLWRAIRELATRVATLPAGVSFAANAIVLDLRALGGASGWSDVSHWLEDARVEGPQDGLWILELRLRVPEDAGQSDEGTNTSELSRQSQTAGQSRTTGLSRVSPEILQHLAGGRVQLELRLHEALANEVLGLVRAQAARPSAEDRGSSRFGDLLAARWPSAVRDLSVRFHVDYVAVSADVEV